MNSNQSPAEFFAAGGSLHRDLPSYVIRPADEELLRQALAGNFCYILTPRQMGKSSLIVRVAQKLEQVGLKTVILDLTTIGTASSDQWYQSLLRGIKRRLNLSINPKFWWQDHDEVSPVQRFIDYLRDVALIEVESPIVIFIDEIDYTLHFDFKDDFFAAIRAIYNARAHNDIFKRLTFVLLGAASPSDLMKDHRHTPFNVGHRINLREFSQEDAVVLRNGLELFHPGQGEPVFSRIYHWTNGHPYLTQKLCLIVADKDDRDWIQTKVDETVQQLFLSTEINESEEDNLKSVQSQILEHQQRRKLLKLYKRIYQGKEVGDDSQSILHNQLKLSGLVSTQQGQLRVSNEIYRQVFGLEWIKANLPFYLEHLERITVAVVIAVLVFVTGFIIWQGSQQQSDEVLAQAYEENFNTTTNPTLRLDNLANLFGLPGNQERAQALFNSLLPAEKISLFTDATPDLAPQLRAVVKGTYTELSDTEANNELLTAMHSILSRSPEADSAILANEIARWLDGRAAMAREDWPSAKIAYDNAIDLNDGNMATHYERAVVLVALDDYYNALTEFDIVVKIDERRQPQIQQLVLDNQDLYNVLWLHKDEFAEIITLVPTPTGTATPTATSTPAPPSSTPTHTATPTNTPILNPDLALETALRSAQAISDTGFAAAALQTITGRPPTRQDDFSDPLSGFGEVRDDRGYARYQDNVYLIESNTCCVNSIRIGPYIDLVVQVDMWIDGFDRENPDFGALSIRRSSAGFYVFHLNYFSGSELSYNMGYDLASSDYVELANGPLPAGLDTALGTWHNVIAVTVGNQMAFFVDGALALTIKDEKLTEGFVNLYAGAGSAMKADNLRIWDLSNPPSNGLPILASPSPSPTAPLRPTVVPTPVPPRSPNLALEAAIHSAQDSPGATLAESALQAAMSRIPTHEDNFSDPSSGFWQVNDGVHLADYVNNEYLMEAHPESEFGINSGPRGTSFAHTDVVVQVDMRVNPLESRFPSSGLLFLRQTSLTGHYLFSLGHVGSELYYSLGVHPKSSAFISLAQGKLPTGFDGAKGSWHNVILVAVGDQIWEFVDGTLMTTTTDDTLTQGVFSMGAAPGSSVRVDNLRFWDVSDLSTTD